MYYYTTGVDFKICLQAQKVTAPFEKWSPGLFADHKVNYGVTTISPLYSCTVIFPLLDPQKSRTFKYPSALWSTIYNKVSLKF